MNPQGSIFIRRIGFLIDRYFRVSRFKIDIIKKNDMSDNAQSIGKDDKFILIAEIIEVDRSFEKLEKGRGMINGHVLTI